MRPISIFGLLMLLLGFAFPVLAQSNSTQEPAPLGDLGTLGGVHSYAYGINSNGWTVGASLNLAGNTRSFRWNLATRMVDMGTLGGRNSTAYAVNDNNEIVGNANLSNGYAHAFYWNGQQGMRDLGTLGGRNSTARAINRNGTVNMPVVIVGEAQRIDGKTHAFIYTNNTMTDLGTLGGMNSYAYSVNNAGIVAGAAQTPDGTYRACIWQKGSPKALSTLGGANCYAFGINNLGIVVGKAQDNSGLYRPVVWQNGQIFDLRTLTQPDNPNDFTGTAYSINDRGEIIGQISIANFGNFGFRFRDGSIEELGEQGFPAGAYSISNDGRVAGMTRTHDGTFHAFHWFSTYRTQPFGSFFGWNIAAFNDLYYETIAGTRVFFDDPDYALAAFTYNEIDGFVNIGRRINKDTSFGRGVNNQNEVVGFYYVYSPAFHFKAFLFDKMQRIIELVPDADSSAAMKINDAGEVIGYYSTRNKPNGLFYWHNGEIVDIIEDDAIYDLAGLNNYGQVLLNKDEGNDDQSSSYIWDRFFGLHLIGEGVAKAINNNGVVLGATERGSPILWDSISGRRVLNSDSVVLFPLFLGGPLDTTQENINDRNEFPVWAFFPVFSRVVSAGVWNGNNFVNVNHLLYNYAGSTFENLLLINNDRTMLCSYINQDTGLNDYYILKLDVPGGTSRAIGTINPSARVIPGGASLTATVNVNAYDGLTNVRFRSSHPSVQMPDQMPVQGSETLTVPITTSDVAGEIVVTLFAEALNTTSSTTITVLPATRTVNGRITLQGSSNTTQTLTARFQSSLNGGETFTLPVLLDAAGNYSLRVPARNFIVGLKGEKWLRKTVAVDTTVSSVFNLNMTLFAGDANNDNAVDILDLSLLISSYNKRAGNANFNPAADLNLDGAVDISDLVLVIGNYNRRGDN